MRVCKITVVKKSIYHDLIAKYENPIEHPCNLSEGMVFFSINAQKPEGLCESAWSSMANFVNSLAVGTANLYNGWMKNPNSAVISCNDGFRPVSFLIEAIDDTSKLNLTPAHTNIISNIQTNDILTNIEKVSKNGFVVGIGEVLWDLLPSGRQIGGAPANFAFHAKQLGLNSIVASAVGNDNNGNDLLECMTDKGISYLAPKINRPTGTVTVSLKANGIPSYNIKQDVAWDYIPLSYNLLNLAHHTIAVCFGSLAQRNSTSRSTINAFINNIPAENNALKIFDVNLRQNFHSKDIIYDSLIACNILKINDDELTCIKELFSYNDVNDQTFCKQLIKKFNLRYIILTCGEHGSYVFSPHEVSFLSAPKVEVADTVGAGDAFTAAFVASIINGCSFNMAHVIAADIASYVCTQNGAMPILNTSLLKKY